MKMKQLLWGFLMIASVALAGCGSNGDGGRIADLQDLLDAANVDLTKANDDLTKANDDLAKANDDLAKAATAATDLEEELGAANGMILALNIQIDAAPTQEMVDELTSKRDEYKKEAEGLQTMLDAANTNLDTVNDRVTELEAQVAKLTTPDPDAMAKLIDVAIKLPKSTRTGESGGLDDSRRPQKITADGAVKVTLKSDGKLTSAVDVDTLGKEGKDDPNSSGIKDGTEFMKSSDAPVALGVKGWDDSIHERTVGKVTDTVTVYSNMAAPTDEAFETYYGKNGVGTSKVKAIQSSAVTTATLTFAVASIPANEAKYFVGDKFPTGSNMVARFLDDSTTTIKEDKDIKFNGSFHGVAGEYLCTTGCEAENDKNGNLYKLTGTWTFKATSIETKVEGVIPDSDYLQFGYWLQKTEDEDAMEYGIRTFAGGKDPYNATGTKIENLKGKATYSGPAAGMFVKRAFDSAGKQTPVSSGQFTAKTELTAYFGNKTVDGKGTIAENLLNSINGTVSGFMDGDGNSIDDAWKVTLNNTTFDDNGKDDTFVGKTEGGGYWSGGFFGNPSGNQLGESGIADDYPNSVAGEFTDDLTNGSVIGAFGASR